MQKRSRALLGCAAWMLAAVQAYGQAVTGTVVGVITDPKEGVVPDAQVTARNVETGVSRTVLSNSVGNYSIAFLNPGNYNIEVSRAGFKTFLQENVNVQVASTARVDVQLQVGVITEKVVVTAAPPILQTQSAEVSSTLSQQQLVRLPSLDRKYQDLISLLPGTGRPEQNFTDIGSDDTRLTSVNGLEKYTNNYEIDGLDNNDVILGNTFQVPPIESIQEVHVATSNYDAAFGRAGGAVVSVQTRSGTNELHGSLYEFHRDSFLRARRALPQEDSPPKNVHNSYGATVGGPIAKDRTFFFVDFEGTNDRLGVSQVLSVPIPAFRNGDFSSVLGTPLGITDPAGQMIYSGSIFDPLSGDANGNGRLVFPGNIIRSSRFNPQAVKMTSLLPMPNLSSDFTNNYSVLVPQPRDTYGFDTRIDHAFSTTTNFFAKYNFRNTSNESFSFAGPALRPDGFLDGLGHLRAQTASGTLTHTFGGTTVAELRLGVNRFHYDYGGQNQRTAEDFGIGGFGPGTPLPLMYFYDGSVTNIGFYPYYPLVNNQTTYQAASTWTKAKGKHNLKWGGDFRRMDLLRASRSSNTGTFLFYTDVTRGIDDQYVALLQPTVGDTFASFLLGLPESITRNQLITPPHDLGNNFFAFGQDTWRASPKFTLDFGLRWELYAPITEAKKGGAANYDPATGRLLIAGMGNISDGDGVKFYFGNLAPRFGFAYRLTDQMALRGGYGISYTVHPFGGYGALLSTNFPNVSVQTSGAVGDSIPAGTLAETIPLNIPLLPSNGIYDPAPPDQAFYALAFDAKFPYVQSYNLTLQRELLPDLSLEVAYVGNKATRLFDNYHELNYSLPGSGDDGGALFKKFGYASSVREAGFNANSVYNSLQINLKKLFSHGLALTAAYTWQRGIGYIHAGQPNFPLEFRSLIRGADTNKHQFVSSHIWELPFGRGKPLAKEGVWSRILGGWQYNGIFSAYGGPPFSVFADPSLLNGVRLSGNHPDLLHTPGILGRTGPDQLFFDISAFRDPPLGRYGTAGAQLLYGPGWVNYDASVFRNLKLRGEKALEFRFEVFNVTNTPHWLLPENNIDRPRFGEILSDANDARRVQFAARFIY